jgi:hypothetical protein
MISFQFMAAGDKFLIVSLFNVGNFNNVLLFRLALAEVMQLLFVTN